MYDDVKQFQCWISLALCQSLCKQMHIRNNIGQKLSVPLPQAILCFGVSGFLLGRFWMDALSETSSSHLKIGWLEDDPFILGLGLTFVFYIQLISVSKPPKTK